jgi:hypothetical protein
VGDFRPIGGMGDFRPNRRDPTDSTPIFSKNAGRSFLKISTTYVSNFIRGMSVFEVLIVLLLF